MRPTVKLSRRRPAALPVVHDHVVDRVLRVVVPGPALHARAQPDHAGWRSPPGALPGVAPEGAPQRRSAVAEHGLAVCDEDMLRLQGGHAFQRRQVALAPPAAAALAVQRVLPHAQLTAARLDHGVAEHHGAVGGDLDRLLERAGCRSGGSGPRRRRRR